MSEEFGCYYLHTNGNLIYKPRANVPDFMDSDFVRHWWLFNPKNRENAWTILVEALSLGADKTRIMGLAEKWGCDNKDAETYCERIGVVLKLDGDKFCAHKKDFVNQQESPVGFGDTALEALAELCKSLGFSAGKLWAKHFKELVKP